MSALCLLPWTFLGLVFQFSPVSPILATIRTGDRPERRRELDKIYLSLLLLFAVFGAFCFNMGHKRAYKVVLKSLLRGQIDFAGKKIAALGQNRASLSAQDFSKAYFSYETVGQLVIGWYRYFAVVRNDKELRLLKARMKGRLEEYLAVLEEVGQERGFELDAGE
jgi:hypothetical protein